MVSLGDVAARAAVSKSTASKVFNGRADVAPATRARVTLAATELGYNPPVRAPAPGVTQIWAAFSSLDNAYSATVLQGLLTEAYALDATLTVSEWGSVAGSQPLPGTPAWLRQSQERGAQGFVLVTTPLEEAHVAACRGRGSPLVVIDPISHAPEGVMSVGATNWRGGVQATEHLLDFGHRRFAFVGAPPTSIPARERLAGFRHALEDAGIDPEEAVIRPGSFHYDDGLACRAMLKDPMRPTAIFAASDVVALGVLEAARQVGVRVPDELSVVGFDDTFAAQAASPQLTTVRQPLMQMGRMAMQAVVAGTRIGTRAAPPVQMATKLVRRGSTGSAP